MTGFFYFGRYRWCLIHIIPVIGKLKYVGSNPTLPTKHKRVSYSDYYSWLPTSGRRFDSFHSLKICRWRINGGAPDFQSGTEPVRSRLSTQMPEDSLLVPGSGSRGISFNWLKHLSGWQDLSVQIRYSPLKIRGLGLLGVDTELAPQKSDDIVHRNLHKWWKTLNPSHQDVKLAGIV